MLFQVGAFERRPQLCLRTRYRSPFLSRIRREKKRGWQEFEGAQGSVVAFQVVKCDANKMDLDTCPSMSTLKLFKYVFGGSSLGYLHGRNALSCYPCHFVL
jgi:hypothetical protein